jgi:hypothetical protein
MPAVFATIDPSENRRARRRRRRSPVAGIALITGVVLVGAACGDDGGSAERFCGEVAANRDALTNPQLVYSDDIEPLLDLYRDIGDLAPLAVEADWNQLVSAYETASTVLPGDQESEQEALAAIYSSEESAAAIDAWLRANCAVDIGPVFTIVPHTPVTGPAPTVPDGTVAP